MKRFLRIAILTALATSAKAGEPPLRGLANGNGCGLLAEIDIPGNSKVAFTEIEPGLVLIEATLSKEGAKFFKEKKADQQGNDGPDRKLKNDKKESDDIVKLYKKLTGSSKCPKELEEAQALVSEAGLAPIDDLDPPPPAEIVQDAEGLEEIEDEGTDNGHGRHQQACWWIDDYCTSNYNVNYFC